MTNTVKADSALRTMESILRRRERCYKTVALAERITDTEAEIIAFLCANDDVDIFQRDIEKEFNQRRSTISGIVKEMEAKELVIRTSVIADARLKKVTPTEKARGINESILKSTKEFASNAIGSMDDELVDAFAKIANEFKSVID